MQETPETRVRSLGRKDQLERGMAIHSSILTWRIPWTEKPGGLQFLESQKSRRRLSNLNSNLTAVSVLWVSGSFTCPPPPTLFSSSLRVAHLLSAKALSQGHNLIYELEKERERRNRTEAVADLEKPGGPGTQGTAAARRHSPNFRSASRIPHPGPPFPVTLTWHWQDPDNLGVSGGRHLLPKSPAAGAPADYGYQAESKGILQAICAGANLEWKGRVGGWGGRWLRRARKKPWEGVEGCEGGREERGKKRGVLRSEFHVRSWP